jgi:hypothetical protein
VSVEHATNSFIVLTDLAVSRLHFYIKRMWVAHDLHVDLALRTHRAVDLVLHT